MFNELSGPRDTRLKVMFEEVERIYATALTRIVRNPRAKSAVGNLPIWIVFPDFPVPKHAKQTLSTIALNDGMHVHAIALIPPVNRMNISLGKHLRSQQGLYLGKNGLVARVHAKKIRRAAKTVTAML